MKMAKSKLLLSLFMMSSLLLLSGCWDYKELDDMAYVVVIGLDKAEKDEHLIKVSYVFSNPQVGTSTIADVAKNEKSNESITLEAPNIVTAKDLSNIFVSRRIDFTHLRLLVVGEEFARTEEAKKHISQLARDSEVRSNIFIMVTKEPAYKFIRENKPIFETRIHRYVSAITLIVKKTGLTPNSLYLDYASNISEPYSTMLSAYSTTKVNETSKNIGAKNIAGDYAKQGGDSAEILGAAVIKQGVMIGKLTGNEVRLANLVSASLVEDINRSFPDPKKENEFISLKLRKNTEIKNKVKINLTKEFPEINVTVPLQLEVLSSPSSTNYITNKQNRLLLSKHIKQELEKETSDLIAKSQNKYGDIFGFHYNARTQFLKYKDWIDYNWEEKYKHAKISISYVCTCKNFGKVIAPVQGGEQ